MYKLFLLFAQVAIAALIILFWHLAATTHIIGDPNDISFFFSKPSDVAAQIWRWIEHGTIWYHLWITLEEAMLAFVIGALSALVVGFWFARKPLLADIFDPYVKAANALPRVVLAPIFMLWFGLGIWSKVALGVTLVFFIVFFNVYQGVREVDRTVLSNAKMLGMNERQLLRHVYLPSALSVGLFVSPYVCWICRCWCSGGRYLGAAAGLGYLIQQAEGVFDIAGSLCWNVCIGRLRSFDRLGGYIGRKALAGVEARC